MKKANLFFFLCNEQGLYLPCTGYLSMVRDGECLFTIDFNYTNSKSGYTHNYTNLFALMQHYGSRTPLLDWTFDPLVAVYFAAISAVRYVVETHKQLLGYQKEFGINDITIKCHMDKILSSSLSIWALKRNNREINKEMYMILPGYRNNYNLSAQKGIFTFVEPENNTDGINTRTIDEIFKKSVNSINPESELIQFNIKYNHLQEILQYLFKNGINANKLFPGYTGAVKTIEELELYYEFVDLQKKFVRLSTV